jgi:hypothetical protein
LDFTSSSTHYHCFFFSCTAISCWRFRRFAIGDLCCLCIRPLDSTPALRFSPFHPALSSLVILTASLL